MEILLAFFGGLFIAFNDRFILFVKGLSGGTEFGMHQSNSMLGLVLALNGAFMAVGYLLIVRKLSGEIDTV